LATVIKLRKVGNSLGFTLPKEEVQYLRASDGDMLTVIRTENGLEISPYDPGFEKKLKAFEKTRSKYRNALRELAK
jgi:putative addiction module antidote